MPEIEVTPGRCVTWHCYEPAPEGPECPKHAAEPLPEIPRLAKRREYQRLRLQNDPAWAERERKRKREINRAKRANSAAREAENARRRAQRARIRQLATEGRMIA